MPVVKDDGTRRARAHPRRRPAQRAEALRRAPRRARGPRPTRRSAPRSARAAARSARSASTGEVIADDDAARGQFVAGANRDGWHLRGVEAGRDFEPRVGRPPRAARGRPLPDLRRRARLPHGDRGRPHLQLRHASTPSRSARRSSTRTARRSRCSAAATGSGPAGSWPRRSSSATTTNGIVWPAAIAPYDVHVVALRGRRGDRARGGGGAVRGRLRRAARRPRPAGGREVRRRRPDRLPAARHRGQEDPRGRRGRRPRPRNRRREAVRCERARQGCGS